ncbi:MAG: hypothetical protein EOP04_33510 [Proteobacteria bacterium]|nr:MAG: hypothetical protein EOP04_33510 [Pseudomonadota bacterium]
MQQKVQDVRKRMIADGRDGKNLLVVKETLVDYEVPEPLVENADEFAILSVGITLWIIAIVWRS